MQTLHIFQVIAIETFRALLGGWPISLAVLGAAAIGFVVGGKPSDKKSVGSRALLSVIYGLPFLTMLVGALLVYDGPRIAAYEPPPAWKGFLLWFPVLGGIACVATLIIRTRGGRIRSFALAAPGVWINVCATVVAGMAIAGVGA